MRFSLREFFTFYPQNPVVVRKDFTIEGKTYRAGTFFEWRDVMVNGRRIDDRMLHKMFHAHFIANAVEWDKVQSLEENETDTERVLKAAEAAGNKDRFIFEGLGKSWIHIYDSVERRRITPKRVRKGEVQDVIKEYKDALEKTPKPSVPA